MAGKKTDVAAAFPRGVEVTVLTDAGDFESDFVRVRDDQDARAFCGLRAEMKDQIAVFVGFSFRPRRKLLLNLLTDSGFVTAHAVRLNEPAKQDLNFLR